MLRIGKIVAVLALGVLVTVLGVAVGWQLPVRQTSGNAAQAAQQALGQPREMTLLEAWDTLEAWGKAQQPEATVAFLQSVDVDGDTTLAGQDGYRRGWLAVLVSRDTSLWVRMVDGKIVDRTVQPRSPDFHPLSRPGDMDMDSPKALAIAQAARPAFAVSDDMKGLGFHFALDRSGDREVVIVTGMAGRRPARICLDPGTGIVLSSQIYTYAPVGGVLYSTDSGHSWKASTLTGKMVIVLARSPLRDRAYAIAAEKEGIFVYQSDDGGKTWQALGRLPKEAGDWAFDLAAIAPASRVSLLVGTWTGIWFSEDGRAWSRVEGLPEGPVQQVAVIQSEQGFRVLASISAGASRGLYSSRDLKRWVKLEGYTYRLSESFDRRTILAVNEEKAEGIIFDLENRKSISLPGLVLEASGDFQGSAPILLRSPVSGLGVAKGVEDPVKWGPPAPVAKLAASPDFPIDGVALAGGFRSGIYRTADWGNHWEPVLKNPSDIVPGSNEVYDIVFVSPTAVIAVNGGGLAWEDF